VPEFMYSDLLPLGQDGTTYRQLASDGVTSRNSFGRNFLEIEPQLLTVLTSTAMHDIAHLLRPAHLRQLRSVLDDPEASPNDRYVARDLLKNACIAAGGVLPNIHSVLLPQKSGKGKTSGGSGTGRVPEPGGVGGGRGGQHLCGRHLE